MRGEERNAESPRRNYSKRQETAATAPATFVQSCTRLLYARRNADTAPINCASERCEYHVPIYVRAATPKRDVLAV